MVADIPNEMDLAVKSFLHRVVGWAKNEPGLLALALVGSHARGEAVAESDVDLILLFTNSEAYLKTCEWVYEFGKPVEIKKRIGGK